MKWWSAGMCMVGWVCRWLAVGERWGVRARLPVVVGCEKVKCHAMSCQMPLF